MPRRAFAAGPRGSISWQPAVIAHAAGCPFCRPAECLEENARVSRAAWIVPESKEKAPTMRNLMRKLWNDDGGALIASEWLFVATILVIGTSVGLVNVRNAVNSEMGEFANALL